MHVLPELMRIPSGRTEAPARNGHSYTVRRSKGNEARDHTSAHDIITSGVYFTDVTRRGSQRVGPLYLNYGPSINNGLCVATFGNLSRNTIIMMANTLNYGRLQLCQS